MMSKTQQQKSSPCSLHVTSKVANSRMPNLATWMQEKDEKWFRPFLAKHPAVYVYNARKNAVSMEQIHGLLLTGGVAINTAVLRPAGVTPPPLVQAGAGAPLPGGFARGPD